MLAGTLDASGAGAGSRGGDVVVLGDKVGLTGSARIDASGAAGGGTIRIGGDYQGGNADLPNASMVTVQAGARLNADATAAGDGGRVIVWSDKATRFAGTLSARGGSDGGDGGFAEVSGKAFLDFGGEALLTAPHGKLGTLLLDPQDIVVGAVADLNGSGGGNDDLPSPDVGARCRRSPSPTLPG